MANTLHPSWGSDPLQRVNREVCAYLNTYTRFLGCIMNEIDGQAEREGLSKLSTTCEVSQTFIELFRDRTELFKMTANTPNPVGMVNQCVKSLRACMLHLLDDHPEYADLMDVVEGSPSVVGMSDQLQSATDQLNSAVAELKTLHSELQAHYGMGAEDTGNQPLPDPWDVPPPASPFEEWYGETSPW